MELNSKLVLVVRYTTIILLSSSGLLISEVDCVFYQIKTSDGCPYSFDSGNYGIIYLRPAFCRRLLPDYANLSETPVQEESPYKIKMRYTDEEGVYMVEVSSEMKLPMIEIWLTTSRLDSHGKFSNPAGTFLSDYNYELYCCDWSKTKNVARYHSFVDTRAAKMAFHTAYMMWSPMRFTGRFVFVANILVNETTWYGSVTSPLYMMPPQHRPEVLSQDSEELKKSLTFWRERDPGKD